MKTMTTTVQPDTIEATIRRQLTDSLESAARKAGHSLVKKYISTEIGNGFAVVTAPIAREDAPTEKELSNGVDLLYAYVSLFDAKQLKPGFYLVRVKTSGFNFKEGVVVSFIDQQGKVVATLKGTAATIRPADGRGSDEVALRRVRIYGEVCGRKKCFTFTRHGFGDWEFGCTNAQTGQTIDCLQ
jgi:hypothetical protein